MIFKTKNFGEIEISEDKIIVFSDGIPGFEELQKYVIIENPDEDVPFKWLQSVENEELAFVIINPFIFKNDYEFELPQNAIEKLHINCHEDISIYTIVVVPEDINKMTANLAAPIVINELTRKGKQVLLDDDRYHKKHLILEEMKKSAMINNESEQEVAATGEGL